MSADPTKWAKEDLEAVILRLRGEGKTDEQIIDLVAEVMAETLPERDSFEYAERTLREAEYD